MFSGLFSIRFLNMTQHWCLCDKVTTLRGTPVQFNAIQYLTLSERC